MMGVVQNVGAQESVASASDYARLYVGTVEPQYQLSMWHNSPYYQDNTNMYQGRVSYHGVVYEDVLLRFDQLAGLTAENTSLSDAPPEDKGEITPGRASRQKASRRRAG